MRSSHLSTKISIESVGFAVAVVLLLARTVSDLKSNGIWLDEAYSLAAVNNLHLYMQHDGGDMLGYVALLKIIYAGSWSYEALRWLSLLFSISTLFVSWKIGERFLRGLPLACGLIALSIFGYFNWSSTLIRAYALEILLATLVWLLLIKCFETDDERKYSRLIIIACVSSIGVLTHGLFVLQLVPMVLYALLKQPTFRMLKYCGIVLLGPLAMLVYLMTFRIKNVGTYIPGGLASWFGSTLTVFFGTSVPIRLSLLLVLVLGTYLLLKSSMSATLKCRDYAWCIPLLWAVVPGFTLAILSLIYNTFNLRYILPSLPGIALLIGQSIQELNKRIAAHLDKVNYPKAASPVVRISSALLVLFMLFLSQKQTPVFGRSYGNMMASIVYAQGRTGDCIFFASDVPGDTGGLTRPEFESEWVELPSKPRLVTISATRQLGVVERVTPQLPVATSVKLARHCDRLWVVNMSMLATPVKVGVARLPAFDIGLVPVRTWSLPDDSFVRLYVRR